MSTNKPGLFRRTWRRIFGRRDDNNSSESPSDSSAELTVKPRRTLGPRREHVNEAEIEEKCKEHCKYIPHPELDLSDEQIAEFERKCNKECNDGRGVMLNEGGRRRKTRKTRKTRKSRKSRKSRRRRH
jgi:hypothetical protein